MNKLTKGAIAGAAGIALLMGGAGTFAIWNGSASIGGAAVKTGTLSVANGSDTGTWTDASPDATSTTFVPASTLIVPGDVIKYTKQIAVTASGKNLKASVAIDTASVTQQAAGVSYDLDASIVGGNSAASGTLTAVAGTAGAPKTFSYVPGTSTAAVTINVVVVITFDQAATGSQNTTGVNLSGLKVNVTQVRAS